MTLKMPQNDEQLQASEEAQNSTLNSKTNSRKDSSDQDDSSADDIPLAMTLKMPQNDEQLQASEEAQNSTLNSKKNSRKDSSGLDDSSDDEPLMKTKTSPAAKKPKTNENKSGRSNGIQRTSKKADQDDSSADDIPLAMILKMPQNDEQLQASEEAQNSTLNSKKNSRKDSSGLDDSSDDEPLIKTETSPAAKKPKTNENKSGRSNGIQRTSKKADQDDSSDDDIPLAKILKMPQIKTKTSSAAKKPKTNENKSGRSNGIQRTSKKADQDDSSDDDVPLAKILRKPQNSAPTNGLHRTSKKADQDVSSDDDVPLAKIMKKQQQSEKRQNSTLNSKKNSRKDGSDCTSDDEPLIKVAKTLPSKKLGIKDSKQRSRNGVGKNRKTADTLNDHDSSDDEPLIYVAKRLKAQPQARVPLPPPRQETPRCRRKVSKKPLKYYETSSDGSDDEPLIEVKRRKSLSKEKDSTSCIERKEKADDQTPQGETSSEDEPLINMVARAVKNRTGPLSSDGSCDEKQPEPARRSDAQTRRTPVRRTAKAARKIQGETSSEDEPLINMVARAVKNRTGPLSSDGSCDEKQPEPARRSDAQTRRTPVRRTAKAARKIQGETSSEDEPLINMVARAVKNWIGPLSSDESCDEKQPEPVRRSDPQTRRTPVRRTAKAARKIRELSEESTDDEPLMNLVKKPLRAATKATRRKGETASVSKKKTGSGSSGDSSEDEPLRKTARRPHMTKLLSPGSSGDSSEDEPLRKTARRPHVTKLLSPGSSGDSSEDEPLRKTARRPHMTKLLSVVLQRCNVEEAGE